MNLIKRVGRTYGVPTWEILQGIAQVAVLLLNQSLLWNLAEHRRFIDLRPIPQIL